MWVEQVRNAEVRSVRYLYIHSYDEVSLVRVMNFSDQLYGLRSTLRLQYRRVRRIHARFALRGSIVVRWTMDHGFVLGPSRTAYRSESSAYCTCTSHAYDRLQAAARTISPEPCCATLARPSGPARDRRWLGQARDKKKNDASRAGQEVRVSGIQAR